MNRQRIRDDILDNQDKLPDTFNSGTFYDYYNNCRCVLGWLSYTLGGPDPKEADSEQVRDFLMKRYSCINSDITFLAIGIDKDTIIPNAVDLSTAHETGIYLAPARLVIPALLESAILGSETTDA